MIAPPRYLAGAGRSLAIAIALIFVAPALEPVSAAPGVLFQVNSTSDAADPAPGDGFCETAIGNNVCTLRAAIEEANANPNTVDGIRFSIPTSDPGYRAKAGAWTIALNSVLPDLGGSMNITGPGKNKLTVQRKSGSFGIFKVTTAGAVNFSGLTVALGKAQHGGGIHNAGGGTVTITNCTLRNNTATSLGGAVHNGNGGKLTITNSTLSENGAGGALSGGGGGGGVSSSGTLNISGSTFRANLADAVGGGVFIVNGTATLTSTTVADNRVIAETSLGALGGGIYSLEPLTLTSCTVSGNSVTARNGQDADRDSGYAKGGGIFSNGLTLDVINCTVSGNYAEGGSNLYGSGGRAQGGGIHFERGNGTFNLSNSTVAANALKSGRSPMGSPATQGGGVANPYNGTVNVKSTIVADNAAESGADVYGAFASHGFNLIGKRQASTGFNHASDQTGTLAAPLDPLLGPLQNNGGPTATMALQPGSPAIDRGTSASLAGPLPTDQRGPGFSRTVDHAAVANAPAGDGTDSGAFERIAAP